MIRPATAADAPAIALIYNQGIAEGATFETEARTAEERRGWLAQRDPRHPVVVFEAEGQVLGWACLAPFSPRAAYRHVADLSIYVDGRARGRGLGAALIQHLVAQARELGFHKLVLTAIATSPAIRLYERQGFRPVGIYREQGLLGGVWTDTQIMERLL